MKAFKTFNAHDGLKIRYDIWRQVDAKCRGSVVLLGGRSEFIEKYHEAMQELIDRGFHVFTFDWRGQGLSGRMLSNRHKGYVRSFEDYQSDLSQFIEQYVRPEAVKPVICLAHSMGAHIAVRYLHDTPGIIDKAVLTSPLIDIAASGMLRKLLKAVARIAAHAGLNTLYATRVTDFNPARKRFEGNRLTRDQSRYQRMKQMMVENPDVALGGVTFAWIDAMFKSIELVKADDYVEDIMVPVLIVSAGEDQIVSMKAQQEFHRRMKHCRMVTIPDALHELLIETDAVRSRFWDAFDGFVQ